MTKQFSSTLFFVILFTILMGIPTTIFATGGTTGEPAITLGQQNTPLNDNRTLKEKSDEMFPSGNGADAGLPTVTIDDASNWMERKGFEVIGFMQKFIQPFAIVIFILCGMMVLSGSFGNGKLLSKGLFGMFIALIMYVVVLYAPEIMDIFLGWVQS